MTVPLTDLEYPISRFPGTDQTLPLEVGRFDPSPDGLRSPIPFSIPHLDGTASGITTDIIVFYKAESGRDQLPAWSSQVFRFDPATRTMRRIV